MKPLAEKDGTALIEPSGRVLETLKFAAKGQGRERLLARTRATASSLEKWMNAEEWIPLDVVKEACAMNRESSDAPSYSKYLSDCTAGAQFRITSGETIKELPPLTSEEVLAHGSETEEIEGKERALRRTEPSHRVIKITVALFIVPLLGAATGMFVAGPWGAVAGAVMSYALVTILVFLVLIFLPERSRKRSQ